jgi:D-beta-D-heptose 7-phosphate kinase/D-beta-D-heptose 1-phosphate adenosyltransferase
MIQRKIVTLKKLQQILAKARKDKKRIVSTNGCFDVLHIGHVKNLAKAKSLGDILIVGINTDLAVRRQKGLHRPVFILRDRMEVIAALDSVDYVFSFASDKPHPWLRLLQPDIHVKGGDRKRRISDQDVVESYGGRVVFTPVHKEKSGHKYATTDTLQKILKL